jgi:uncharacterized membrane protein
MGCIAFTEGICCNPSSSDRQRPEANMFREKIRRLRWVWMVLLANPILVLGQTPAKPTGPAPTAGGGAKKPGVPQTAPAPAAPQSKHFPILLVASGAEPQWSVRIGMKGAERLERAGYPPIALEPGEISADDSGTAWIYRAKDAGTGGDVTVRLSREACTETSAQTKYSFRAVVTHAQIGILNGCAKIAAEEFPEFKQKNLDDDDPEKKKVVPPAITGFKPPVAMAFIDATGKVVLVHGGVTKIVAPAGHQLSLSHDGKRLLFTHDEQGKDRAIMMYDAVSGKNTELMRGLVQRAFWSPDDSRIAFMRSTGQDWTVWTMPVGAPDKALQLSTSGVWALHGWTDAHTVLASDDTKLYFLRTESPPTSTAIREVYGDAYEVMSSDTIRANPANPDLLMVTAYVSHPKAGMPTDGHTGMGGAAFLYELKSKRRVDVTPANVFARDAEWSRDAIQIFFTNPEKAPVICRVFWDGSGYKRVRAGSDLVVGE